MRLLELCHCPFHTLFTGILQMCGETRTEDGLVDRSRHLRVALKGEDLVRIGLENLQVACQGRETRRRLVHDSLVKLVQGLSTVSVMPTSRMRLIHLGVTYQLFGPLEERLTLGGQGDLLQPNLQVMSATESTDRRSTGEMSPTLYPSCLVST